MKLWNVVEAEGVDGAYPRTDWFANKPAAVACRDNWIAEHAEEVEEGEDVSDRVSMARVEVPTSRDAMARWLYAYDVKAI